MNFCLYLLFKMPFDIRFQTPFKMIVSGPSGSGKSTWVNNLLRLKSVIFTKEPAKIFLFYKIMQDIYVEMQENGLVDELINFNENSHNLEDIANMVHPYRDTGGSLLIFDDSMTDLSKYFEDIFCNLSHHENASVILIVQNLFFQSNTFRTISLQSDYMNLMKNRRDQQQVGILAKQFNQNNSAYVTAAYENATKTAYSYLLLDFEPKTKEVVRVRTHLFEFPCKVYIPK